MVEKEAGKQPPSYPRAPPPFPPPNCPRCYSGNTKFCYYNNYSVSQPRYICKECRRYWTHGGVLRNIPCGGTSRKRGRPAGCASSSSQITKPPPMGGSMRYAPNTGSSSSDGHDAFKPEITQTMQAFSSGGCFPYPPPFFFNPDYEFGGVNSAFGVVNVAFSGEATSQPASSTLMFPQLSPLNGFREFGIPFVQHQPPPPSPQPPTAWARHNMGLTSTRHNNFLAIARDANADANVVSINEWSELMDMDNEGDPLQSYNPPSP